MAQVREMTAVDWQLMRDVRLAALRDAPQEFWSTFEQEVGWAWARGREAVHLWVTETNAAARALDERCGFRDSGERQSRPSYPALTDIGMLLRR